MSRIRFRALAAVALLLLSAFFCVSCKNKQTLSSLTATFLKVGKADAAVLSCGNGTLVIDTGEPDDGAELVRFLQYAGVESVDALIITHFDRDHVGGAAALLEAISVKRVLVPAYRSETEAYQTFLAAAETAGVQIEELTETCSFSLGEASVLVEPPASYGIAGTSDDADNELSLITTVTHGNVRLLFMGDAENGRISEWISAGSAKSCNLIKMPHHGVYAKMQKELLATVQPAYAVICDSDKNPAEEKTLNLLTETGAQVYETRNGNVTAVSDGEAMTLSQ